VSSPGYFTLRGSGISLGVNSNITIGVVTNTCLLVGTVFDAAGAGGYYTASTIVFATGVAAKYSDNLNIATTGTGSNATLKYILTNNSPNIVISNVSTSTLYTNICYNFTMFPTS
jgi:hypothetical protein